MTNAAAQRVWSDLPIAPGTVLAEEIEALGMTQKELARALGRPAQVVNEVIRGKKVITEATALKLERVLGIGAHVWLGLESAYQLTLERLRERESLQAADEWRAEFPVSAMAKLGWVTPTRDKGEQVRQLLGFFGVASVDAYRHTIDAVGFRFSDRAKASHGALAAWLRQGEVQGRRMLTHDFDRAALAEAARAARALTDADPEHFLPELKRRFADAGVAFAVVPELPKTGANGVARWLTPRKALIQLNLRYRWSDIFWFTLFHEVAHLLLHGRRGIFVDGTAVDADPAQEAEADAWARDALIPPGDWQAFASRKAYPPQAVGDFAAEVGVSPSIVVGRLQHERRVAHSALNALRTRFAWS